MKKLFTILICLGIMAGSLIAQTPNAFKYQAVVRDNTGQIVVNKNVGFRISILQASATGSVVYSEKHTAQTNAFGLVNLEIGNGTILSGIFSSIDWAIGSFFVKIELDANNSGSFSEMGTSQLLSVPYSLYAKKAGNGLTISGTPQPGDILFNNGINWGLLSKGINGQTLRLNNGLPTWGEPGYALPMVTTSAVTDVLQTGATSGGNVIATGYSDITARGVCWSIAQNPTTADSKTTDPVGIGTFTSKLTALLANTTYYARAYATNSAGTAYGNQVTFKTFLTVVFPTITTTAASNITENSAVSGGNVTATGGAEVTAKGICWGINQNPTIADNKTNDGTGTGQYASQMSNLEPGTTYYVRAYATNSAGTGYGSQVSLIALKTLPKITTKNITSISAMGGVSGGTIVSTGGGTISDKGICWGENENPTVNDNKITNGAGSSAYTSAIITAVPGTMYYVRAYATNELGTVYGLQKSFTALSNVTYYDFESGMKPMGWSGNWSTFNTGFNSNYCLRSAFGQKNDISITLTLDNPGQLRFFYKFSDYDGTVGWGSAHTLATIQLYIDDILIYTYTNDVKNIWLEGLSDITPGKHTIKWSFNPEYWAVTGNVGYGYLDYVVITK